MRVAPAGLEPGRVRIREQIRKEDTHRGVGDFRRRGSSDRLGGGHGRRAARRAHGRGNVIQKPLSKSNSGIFGAVGTYGPKGMLPAGATVQRVDVRKPEWTKDIARAILEREAHAPPPRPSPLFTPSTPLSSRLPTSSPLS